MTPAPAHILIVEDEPIIRSVLAQLLRAKGHRVSEAGNGEDAVERLADGPDEKPFDLLVLDLTLPGELSGHQVLAECRSRHPALPVIIASGYAMESDVKALCNDGRTEFLCKPYSMNTLLSVADRLLSA